jgi:phosphoribosylaminoimidazole-succinocarboxamide synthase
MAQKRRKLYEGKAKILYKDKGNHIVQYFKDDATAFNAKKRTTLRGKGIINNLVSAKLMDNLISIGIDNHFIRRLSWREQLIHHLQMMPLEIVVRNIATGSLTKRLGINEGERLARPLIEFYLKNDSLNDPIVSEEHILCFEWASPQDIDDMTSIALRVNDFLCGLFSAISITLVDFKIEFGHMFDEKGRDRLMIGDEITPDTCRFWDTHDKTRLDKDRFRLDLDNPLSGYQEIARRLGVLPPGVLEGTSENQISSLENQPSP